MLLLLLLLLFSSTNPNGKFHTTPRCEFDDPGDWKNQTEREREQLFGRERYLFLRQEMTSFGAEMYELEGLGAEYRGQD